MDLLRFTTAGSVDDGKSTLIGRLLHDSKAIFQDQIEALEQTSKLRGEDEVNLALLTDGLRAEREQGITIDVAYRYFSTPKRKFIIADTPGHVQYTRNMVTGASTADLAIVLIDARNGVLTQSKRHGFIASLLGIQHVIVAVNKMDLVGYSREVFENIVEEYKTFSERLNVHDITFIPVSALKGDNIVEKSEKMDWYSGNTVLFKLENVIISADRNLIDFRFPVQLVIRPHQDFRGFAGRIASGTIKQNEDVVVLPSMRTTKIKEIVTHEESLEEAFESQSVVLTLEDEVDISRGDMIVRRNNIPEVGTEFEATLCWMDHSRNLQEGKRYYLQHTTNIGLALIERIEYKIDVNTLHREQANQLELNEIGRVRIKTTKPVFFDEYRTNRNTGSFILIDESTNITVGAGIIRGLTRKITAPNVRSENVTYEKSKVLFEERVERNGHSPLLLWFTGLSGAGKTTIARALERRLFDERKHVFHLDGDNIRHGLSGDLGFSREDRKENLRRVGHAARLLFDAGNIVLCTFISPFESDRTMVKALFPPDKFVEIYVKCSIDECKRRDPKRLYVRASRGEIKDFTGVSSPYEEPVTPNFIIDTDAIAIQTAVEDIYRSITEKLRISN